MVGGGIDFIDVQLPLEVLTHLSRRSVWSILLQLEYPLSGETTTCWSTYHYKDPLRRA